MNSTDVYIPLPPPINATSSNSLAGYGSEFQTVLTPERVQTVVRELGDGALNR